MFFGDLNFIHILSKRKLDEGERGRTETSENSFATGEIIRLNHSHSETLRTPWRCPFLASILHIAVVCRHVRASST